MAPAGLRLGPFLEGPWTGHPPSASSHPSPLQVLFPPPGTPFLVPSLARRLLRAPGARPPRSLSCTPRPMRPGPQERARRLRPQTRGFCSKSLCKSRPPDPACHLLGAAAVCFLRL